MTKTDVYEEITTKMVAALEAGTVPWQKPWTSWSGPRNIKGHQYRGINVLILMLSGFESPVWMTYKQAKEAGGSVKKGEHGTQIVFWKRLMVTDKETGDRSVVPLLRTYTVFNLTQTEGVKVPKRTETEMRKPVEHSPIESAEAILKGYKDGPTVREAEHFEALYIPSQDRIEVPARENFDHVADFYLTLFHELGHSTGHESRCNRKVANGFGTHDYGREELVAEMTAAFLGAEAGVEPSATNNSAAYLASWIRTIKEDVKAVVVAAGAAQRAADHILGRTFEKDETAAETPAQAVAA